MTDDPFGFSDWHDETELDYCPRCGAALEGEHPVECPEHGPVSLTYGEMPTDEEIVEMILGDEDPEDVPLFDAALIEDIFGAPSEEAEHEGREQPADGGVRDRINRFIGRG